MRPTIKQRIDQKTAVNERGCWVWQARLDRHGYGAIWVRDNTLRAHRVSYEEHVGPIPPGLELDHLCRNPACVNPEHLEPVTHLENMRRGTFATRTHCKHGHEFTPENTYTNGGKRACKACALRRLAGYQKRKTK